MMVGVNVRFQKNGCAPRATAPARLVTADFRLRAARSGASSALAAPVDSKRPRP